MKPVGASAVIVLSATLVSSAPPVPAVRDIPYADARPVIDNLRPDLLPDELRAKPSADRELSWPAWVSSHDAAIRARIERGDRDSLVNLLLFGTSFTKRPRTTGSDLAALKDRGREALPLFAGRIADLAAGIARPGSNERLKFVRQFLERLGLDAGTPAGRHAVEEYFAERLLEAPAELDDYSRALGDARSRGSASADVIQGTLFRHRGLSTDTSLLIDFALDQALEAMQARGLFPSNGVSRIGIVGPGLDFTDKHDGHDFYPQQTIQPFAIADSLVRLGLAKLETLRLTTFDVSPRIVEHLEAARERARLGQRYGLVLPRNMDLPWSPPLVRYWEGFGNRIGGPGEKMAVPPNAGDVAIRSVRIAPPAVLSIAPRDLNVVLQRLEPLSADERFDLIVATDVLVYYDVFEQSLALANIASMLRPGGFLLVNSRLFELPALPIAGIGSTDVVHMTMPVVGDVRDRIFWYQRE